MIQAIMLVALGFLVATLMAVLLAPSLWSRALRLSKKRLEATLPLSLAEIDESRDQIRAAYAVRLRRLEIALAKAKQRVALQLVDNSRLQMQIATLGDAIASTELKLEERQNAALVLEQTITRHMPELERDITTRKAELQIHSQELDSLQNRLSRREEQLAALQQTASSTQDELDRLRQAMEKTGSDKGGRLLRRPSQWTLDDYRSEYDRLHLELSKMRQQLGVFQQKDAAQTGLIKGELQKLAELVLTTRESQPDKPPASVGGVRTLKPSSGVESRRERPAPYPGLPQAPTLETYSNSRVDDEPSRQNPSIEVLTPPPTSLASSHVSKVQDNSAVFQSSGLAISGDTNESVIVADNPKLPRSRIAQDVTAKATQSKLDPGVIIPETASFPSAEKVRYRNGAFDDQAVRPTTASSPLSTRDEPEPSGINGAKKVFADAQQLQTISELALAQDLARGPGLATKSNLNGVAREAGDGLIIDAEVVGTDQSRRENTGISGNGHRNLLERLRDASEEVETVDQ